MSQTQPLATGSSPTSTIKPANRFDFICVCAQRRHVRSAASRSAFGIFAIAFHMPRRWRTRRSKSPRVARRTIPRTTVRGFGAGTCLFRIRNVLTLLRLISSTPDVGLHWPPIPRNLHLDSAPLRRVSSDPRILVAVSGASGVEYARRLIEILGDRADVVTTKDAQAVIEIETGLTMKEFTARARSSYGEDNLAAAPASGSSLFRAVVVGPCSVATLAKIAPGIGANLVQRAAPVALKENRKLILVPRETPVRAIALEDLLELARLGGVIMPASPCFYGKPKRIADLPHFVVARILDYLGVDHSIGVRWSGPE